jgi:hypothetical protein
MAASICSCDEELQLIKKPSQQLYASDDKFNLAVYLLIYELGCSASQINSAQP